MGTRSSTHCYVSMRRLQFFHGFTEKEIVDEIVHSCDKVGYATMRSYLPPYKLQPVHLNLGYKTPCIVYPRVLRLNEQEGFNYLLNNPDKINADNIALFDKRVTWILYMFGKDSPLKHKRKGVVERENEFRKRSENLPLNANAHVYLRLFSYELTWILHHRRSMFGMAQEMMPDEDLTNNGPVLDHLCHRPTCCNIEHLKLTTRSENSRHTTLPKQRRDLFEIDRAFKRLDSIEEKLDALIEVLGNRASGKPIMTVKF